MPFALEQLTQGLSIAAKIDPQTNFRLASCSKQFTAMSIMLLVHDGKLHYDDKLTDVFPDFAAYGQAITIRNILHHTSGFPDYEDLMAAAEKRKGAPMWTPMHQIQDAEVLDLLKQESAGKFPPETQWSYSNSGYVVLGLVVARVSGKARRGGSIGDAERRTRGSCCGSEVMSETDAPASATISQEAEITAALGQRTIVLVGMMGVGKSSIGRRLGARRVPVDDDDLGAALGKSDRGGAADAVAGAGDQRDLAGEIQIHGVLPSPYTLSAAA